MLYLALLVLCAASAQAVQVTVDSQGRYDRMPRAKAQMPASILKLAVSLLGEAGTEELAKQVTNSQKELAGHPFTLWMTKSDTSANQLGSEFGGKNCRMCGVYKYHQLEGKTGVAVDIGANIGDTTMLALAFNPHLQVVSVEASPQTFVLLKWNLAENKIPEITLDDIKSGSMKPGILAIHAAVTRDGKDVTFEASAKRSYQAQAVVDTVSMGTEFLRPGYEDLKWTKVTVPGIALQEWFSKNGVPKPIWLKIDCEGCEYDALMPLHESGLLDNAYVVGEAHPRWLKESCKDHEEREDCKANARNIKDTRDFMCKVHDFEACQRVMKCGLLYDNC